MYLHGRSAHIQDWTQAASFFPPEQLAHCGQEESNGAVQKSAGTFETL